MIFLHLVVAYFFGASL